MKSLNTAPFQSLFQYINYSVLSCDHVHSVSPFPQDNRLNAGANLPVTSSAWGVPDALVAYGGCPLIMNSTSPSIEPAVAAMHYETADMARPCASDGERSGYDCQGCSIWLRYMCVRDDEVNFPFDRVDHLLHIMRCLKIRSTIQSVQVMHRSSRVCLRTIRTLQPGDQD